MTVYMDAEPLEAIYTTDVLMQELDEIRQGQGEKALHSLLSGIQGLVQYHLTHRDIPKLTPREKECLYWVSEGKTSKDIGVILGVSEATAVYHITHFMRKLGTPTRSGAVTKGIKWGLINKPVDTSKMM